MPHTTKHRQARNAGGSVTEDICMFEGWCVLPAYHDGEHAPRGKRPHGTLHLRQWLYTMYGANGGCELCGVMTANGQSFGFYVDAVNVGWIVCIDCIDVEGDTILAC
jgi:hypothetical protein